jgi:hypothetical protein
MKTPREILFQRYQAAEPKLDEIRETAVTAAGDRRIANLPVVADHGYNWREFLFSLRWHLAGMGTAWLLIILLNLNIGHSTTLASAVPAAIIPPPQIILAALRENRRELLQMIQSSDSRDTVPRRLILPQPRSQRSHENLTA